MLVYDEGKYKVEAASVVQIFAPDIEASFVSPPVAQHNTQRPDDTTRSPCVALIDRSSSLHP